ncbi:MAG: hypothetical protein IT555_05660 [Acetobacteraceae bacterium]|nr:hypothetical protein [Acetobacteraceae bacterium]
MKRQPRRPGARLAAVLVYDDTSPLFLALLAGAILAGQAWLLAAPDSVLSRLMTWDLLFNLEGAWRLLAGQVPHADFHDPLGSLAFWPTALGFRLVGPGVFAVIAGKLIVTAVLFAAATLAVLPRLPLLPALVFVLFVCDLVLIPTNTGSLIDHFAFAMSYNAAGWAGLSVLSLILFLPPRPFPPPRRDRPWGDIVTGAALIVALYYLKITYFLVALAALAAALVLSAHIRARRAAWAGVGVLAAAHAVAPYNWAYLADIAAAVQTGAVRSGGHAIVLLASANATELALYGAVLLAGVALWRARTAPGYLPAAIAVLIGCAVLVFSQNAQLRGLPLGCIALFLLYDQLRRILAGRPGAGWALLAVLAYPIASVGSASFSLAAYFDAIGPGAANLVVDRTNLRGLAVPLAQDGAVANREKDYSWLRDLRWVGGDVRVSQAEYVRTLLEAAALFEAPGRRAGGIMLLDQVNPMAFILGRPPPRGVTLWMDTEFPWQPARRCFAEVEHVLIPKLSTYAELTESALAHYGPYLAAHFPVRTETANWVLLSRPAAPP